MPPDREDWARAYAKQSRSDFRLYSKVMSVSSDIEECHRLHYLQMACEKIAKAYRFRDTLTPIEELLTSHVAFSKFIENLLKSAVIRHDYQGKDAKLRRESQFFRNLAREVEKLAPAVDRVATPQNAEYPWEDAEQIIVPSEYGYPNLVLLKDPGGRNFLKLIEKAILDFETIKIT
jgi:hypothetical protein